MKRIHHLVLTFLISLAGISCEKEDVGTIPVKSGDSTQMIENELLEAAHIHSEESFAVTDLLILEDNGAKHYMSGTARMEQTYSITPLYAFKTIGNGYSGDFYFVDATISFVSDEMYRSPYKVKWDKFGSNYISGFFLSGCEFDITLVDKNGDKVEGAGFNVVPAPKTSEGSTTYSSGVSWSFDNSLTGGISGGNLSSGAGCSIDNTQTRTLADLSIKNYSQNDGTVSYKLEVQNQPKKAGVPPYIASHTFDFHFSWVWQIGATPELDTTAYHMAVNVRNLEYKISHNLTDDHEVKVKNDRCRFSKAFDFTLPVPNRVPTSIVSIENSVQGSYMGDISFTDMNTGKAYKDKTGSVFPYGHSYKACPPEGDYSLAFKIDSTECKGEGIRLDRGKEVTLSSGFYK